MKHRDLMDLEKLYAQKQDYQRELNELDIIRKLQAAKELRKQRMKYLAYLDPDRLQTGHLKKLTLLHSNDLHGDFLAEEV